MKCRITEILCVVENHVLPQNVVCGSSLVFCTWGNVFLIAEAQGRIFSFIAWKSPSWNTLFRKTAKEQLITNYNLWRIFVEFHFWDQKNTKINCICGTPKVHTTWGKVLPIAKATNQNFPVFDQKAERSRVVSMLRKRYTGIRAPQTVLCACIFV